MISSSKGEEINPGLTLLLITIEGVYDCSDVDSVDNTDDNTQYNLCDNGSNRPLLRRLKMGVH